MVVTGTTFFLPSNDLQESLADGYRGRPTQEPYFVRHGWVTQPFVHDGECR